MKKVISALLAGAMFAGMLPAMPAFAEEEPVLLETQRLEGAEYDDDLSYVMMGTVQSEVEEHGRYILTIYRDGNTSSESSVELKTADVSAKYGIDYIIDDDRYTTDVTPTDSTLLELSANDECVEEAEEAFAEMQGMVDSSTEENEDTTKKSGDEDLSSEDIFPLANSFDSIVESEASENENKSSLAKMKEEQTGLKTRPTYESSMQPITDSTIEYLGLDIADYIETSSSTYITFAPDETEKQVIIKILEDDESEGQEIINFMLSNPGENTALAEPATASVIINDDEPTVHSKISFLSSEFDADEGKAKITVTRDEAEYSYVTAMVRTVENGSAKEGENYAKSDNLIEFRPYKTEASFEIPVAADKDMSFGIELYDLKGGEDGEFITAQVNIKANKENPEISLFDSNKVTIADKEYRLDFSENAEIGKIMDDSKDPAVHVGNYYIPTPDYVEYGHEGGYSPTSKDNKYIEKEKCGYLRWYHSWYRKRGGESAIFYTKLTQCQSVYLDFQAYSGYDGARCGFYTEFDDDILIRNKNSRAVRGPSRLIDVDNGNKVIASDGYADVTIEAMRIDRGLSEPEMKFWGIITMFREFHISVQQPDEMEFRTPDGTIKQAPAVATLGEGQDVRYNNESATINATPLENGGTVNGTLKGYEIQAGPDATPFFYETNSATLKFDDDFILMIDRNTSTGSITNKGYYTQLYIKPVYEYIPVTMEILPNKDNAGTFKSDDLQKSSSDVFHVGDILDMDAEPSSPGYFYSGYHMESYKNPGDTAPEVSGDMTAPLTLALKNVKYSVSPNFSTAPNHIEIQMDVDAKNYFETVNIVPEDSITNEELKGKMLFNTASADKPDTLPTAGKAYKIEFTETAENGGKYRPVITHVRTGTTVQGFAMDFLAEARPIDNIIRVTAQEYDQENYQYFSLSGHAYYSSVSVRQSSDALLNEPAIGAVATSGAALQSIYGADKKKIWQTMRQSGVVGEDGMFEIDGIKAISGDTVSVLLTNNDIDQVAYCTLTDEGTEKVEKSFDELLADDSTQTNINNTVTTDCSDVNMSTVNMPIRTPYSPYVTDVRYSYATHSVDTRNNSVPLYDDDSLTLTAELNLNNATIKKVEFIRYDKDGNERETYEASKNKDSLYDADVDTSGISDGDKIYVRIVGIDSNNNEKKYATLNTGLVFFTPETDAKPQYIAASVDQLGSLPVLGKVAAGMDTGKLKWETTYADPKNKSTSAYAQTVMVAVSVEDIQKNKDKLNKIKNGKTKSSKSVEDQVAQWDPATEASQADRDELTQSLEGKTDEERESIYNSWTEKQKAAQREKLKAEQYQNSLTKLGEKEWDLQFKLLLQFEYAYNYEKNEHVFVDAQYLIGGTFNIQKTWYWIVYGVPVYLNVAGYAAVQCDGCNTPEKDFTILAKELKQEENLVNAHFESTDPWFQIGAGVKLQPGVGICGILGVRGVFQLDGILRVECSRKAALNNDHGGAMISMSGGVGIDLIAFSFNYTIGKKDFAWGVYDEKRPKLSGIDEEANISIRTFDRGDETDTLLGKENISLSSTIDPVNRVDLVQGAMEYVRPEIEELDDGRLMMVYLRNDKNRNDVNAASLAYTIKDGDNWSEPVYIDEDDTADSHADILCDGDKVYIAWSSAADALTGNTDDIDSVKSDLQKMDIKMRVYDVSTQTMSDIKTVTNDEYLNSDVRLVKEDNNIALYYMKKDISGAEDKENLVSLTSNYNTFAKRLFNPDSDSFVKVPTETGEADEKLIYIKHQTVDDPLVYDYAVEDYTYDNGTEDTSDDIKYSLAAYSVDKDKNINTNNDREVWLEITDLTNGKEYYPIKADSDKNDIINVKLTKVNNDVLLTWLSETHTFNTVSIKELFDGMRYETGNVNGEYTGTTGYDLFCALTDEEAAGSNWCELLAQRAKESLPSDEQDNFSELFGAVNGLAEGNILKTSKDFSQSGNASGINMSDYHIIVGDDGNTYLFWTGPAVGKNNLGTELYGTSYYRLNDEWQETWEEGSKMPLSGWGDPVQLTEFGQAIDEMTIEIDKDKKAVIIANMYDQTVDEEGNVKYGNHNLVEIDCIPSNSLEIVDNEILLSDEYPTAGEKIEISTVIMNNGLLPSTGDQVTIKVLQNGNVVFSDSVSEEGNADMIYVGNKFKYSTEWTPKNLDGEIKVVAEVKESGTENIHTAEKVLEKKSNIKFGTAYEWSRDEITNELSSYPENTSKENMIPELSAIYDKLYGNEEFDYVVYLPVENAGNVLAENISATAQHMDKEFKLGDTVGTSMPVSLDAKQSGLIAIPIKVEGSMFDSNGILEMQLFANQEEINLDNDRLHHSIYETKNVYLTLNDGLDSIELNQNDTFKIEPKAYPFDSIKKMYYFSDNHNVATVTDDGVITATGGGTTNVCAMDLNGMIFKNIEVSVKGTEPTATPKHSSSSSSLVKATPTPTPSPAPEATLSPSATDVPTEDAKLPFTDVKESDWFYDNVKYVYENKLFSGVSDDLFAPNEAMTRAMLVTVLYRAAGEPDMSEEIWGYPFEDVDAQSWYGTAVYWARNCNIIEGYSENEFVPDAPITREQLAAILYRYAQFKGVSTNEIGDLSQFTDAGSISAWAQNNVGWAVGKGLLTGRDNGTLDPTGNTTRAEVAAMLQRFNESNIHDVSNQTEAAKTADFSNVASVSEERAAEITSVLYDYFGTADAETGNMYAFEIVGEFDMDNEHYYLGRWQWNVEGHNSLLCDFVLKEPLTEMYDCTIEDNKINWFEADSVIK